MVNLGEVLNVFDSNRSLFKDSDASDDDGVFEGNLDDIDIAEEE